MRHLAKNHETISRIPNTGNGSMANKIGALNLNNNGTNAVIDPVVIRFIFALLVAGFFIEIADRISPKIAWTLVFLIVLGLFINNPILTGYLNLGSASLKKGLEG